MFYEIVVKKKTEPISDSERINPFFYFKMTINID